MRLRDRLSHGETSFLDVDRFIADLVLCVIVYACHKPGRAQDNVLETQLYPQSKTSQIISSEASEENDRPNSAAANLHACCPHTCPCYTSSVFSSIAGFTYSYQSLFHPLAFARRDMMSCLTACSDVELFVSRNCLDLFREDPASDELRTSLLSASCRYFAHADFSPFLENVSVHLPDRANVQCASFVASKLQMLIDKPLKTLYGYESCRVPAMCVCMGAILL